MQAIHDFICGGDNSNNFSELNILATHSKCLTVKLQRTVINETASVRLAVEITGMDGNDFVIHYVITSPDQLTQFIRQTIEMLKLCPQFSNYVDDLENCL